MNHIEIIVSEWLLFNAKMSNLPASSWRVQVTLDEMLMLSVLY